MSEQREQTLRHTQLSEGYRVFESSVRCSRYHEQWYCWGSVAQTFVNLFALIARRMSALLLTSLAGFLNVLFLPAIKYNPVEPLAVLTERFFQPGAIVHAMKEFRKPDRSSELRE